MLQLSKLLLLGLILNLNNKLLTAETVANQNLFAANLLPVMVHEKYTENVVYSPASIQTSLTLAFMGAEGKTADEFRQVLKLNNEDKSVIAQNYGEFLKTNFDKTDKEAPILKMANSIYVNQQHKILTKFSDIAKNNFQSKVENLDFSKGEEVAKHINAYVEQNTENKIKNLLKADEINNDDKIILVNAIYFKAKWLIPFSQSYTSKKPFNINAKDIKNVDMMYTDDDYNYAELPELNAKIIELPYENSDISMLIILPNEIEGLKKLEDNLKGKDLNEITKTMSKESVDLSLPKFHIEFDIDLNDPLDKMGLTTMFSSNADFRNLLDSEVPLKVSNVKHKAFLDVNEAGSEAAAATFMKIQTYSLNPKQKTFRADHPFFFAIRSKTSVYFAGHVAKLD